MFVQPESFGAELPTETHGDWPVPSADFASNLSSTVKELGTEMLKSARTRQ